MIGERHFALKIAYDGTGFHGFQKQPGLRTVQGVLEETLGRFCGAPCTVRGSGRTDAGVHARGQVVSFCGDYWPVPLERMVQVLNGALPEDMAVLAAVKVPASFHPRYDAVSKTYVYTVFRRAVRCPLSRLYSLHFPEELDTSRMHDAITLLIGTHDFSAFQNTGRPVKSAVRTVFGAHIEEDGPLIRFRFTADGYLYQMVRVIVGTLFEIGRGRLDPGIINRAFETGNRGLLGPTAPPQGLCLERVTYREELFGE
ncbi:MAG: tRNA pseudouridine(38-40) synthase TruA [Bacillota bacterium]